MDKHWQIASVGTHTSKQDTVYLSGVVNLM